MKTLRRTRAASGAIPVFSLLQRLGRLEPAGDLVVAAGDRVEAVFERGDLGAPRLALRIDGPLLDDERGRRRDQGDGGEEGGLGRQARGSSRRSYRHARARA